MNRVEGSTTGSGRASGSGSGSGSGARSGVVAAFDFDGTLTSRSVGKFLGGVVGRRSVFTAGLRVPFLLVRGFSAGGEASSAAKEALFVRTLAGLDAEEFAKQSAELGLTHYAHWGRPEIADRLAAHRAAGHRVVIVSASPEVYLVGVARLVGAEAVIATRLETAVRDAAGRPVLTGRFLGPNCRGAEKWRRLEAWLGGDESAALSVVSSVSASGSAKSSGDAEGRPFVYAYGNSDGDRYLLGGADVGVDVGRLGRFGKLRDFPRLADVAAPFPLPVEPPAPTAG